MKHLVKSSSMGFTENQKEYIGRTKKARLFSNKSQEEIASCIGVARPTYANYERDRPMPQKYISKFCFCTGVSLNWLISGSGTIQEIEYSQEEQEIIEKIKRLEEQEKALINDIVKNALERKNK